MTTDYIVSSLPALAFDAPPPLSAEAFDALAAGRLDKPLAAWKDLEAQLRNAVACCRMGGAKYVRPVEGCSLYWRERIAACFQEHDIAKREDMLDRVFWDAAGELTPPASPLGEGALATYAVRLGIVAKRSRMSRDAGNALFEKLAEAARPEGQTL